MAPEQIDAARLRPATDVWAFGLLTFWLLTGMHYWKSANQEGSTMQALLVEKLVEPMQWPSERAALFQRRWPLGADYDRWFASVVERNPEQRTQSMAQAWAQLEPILQQASQSNAMIGGAPTLMGGPLSAPSMGSWPGSSSVPTGRAMMSYAPGAVAQTVLSSPTGPGPTQTAKNSVFSLAKWLGPAAALSVIALGSIASRYRATPSAISSTMTLESSRGQHVISYSLGAVDAGAIVINESDVLPAIAVVAVTRPESVPEVRRQRISVVPAQRNTRTLVRDAGVAAVAVAQAVQAPTLSPRGRPMGSRCPQYAQSYRLANSFVSRAQLVQATDPAQANSLRLQGAAIRQGLDQQFANQQHMARTTLAGDPDFVDMVRELERCRAQPGFGQF